MEYTSLLDYLKKTSGVMFMTGQEASVVLTEQESGVVKTNGLDPVDVFRALYSHAKKEENEAACDDPYQPGEIPYADAAAMVAARMQNNYVPYFDRVRCRKMHVTILPEEIWADRYNQFNGEGVAQRVISALRKIKGIPE